MCGITGAVPGIDREILRRMTERLAHRGPDGQDFVHRGEVSLGHTRLAVIDRPGGRQPMCTPDGRCTLVYNGEIYNFREVRRDLEALGYVLHTRSDTEVLLQAWAQWGREALPRLRGMFAFAVWDAESRALHLVRDRLGVKPLYYTLAGGRLLFASEIKALLAHPDVARRLNARAVDDYLALLYVPAPQTAFEGICELPPAHWLEWRDGRVATQRYWDARPAPADAPLDEHAAEVRATLREAVRLRLVSDVPLGAFLSGGLDSSSIVACMAAEGGGPPRTFSLGFGAGGENYSELEYARMVAARFGSEHRELRIHATCADLLPRLVDHFDEPFGNPTALLLYQLSELTRRHVTVALAGDGGDELFLGYPRYRGVAWHRRLERMPGPLRTLVAQAARAIPEDAAGAHGWRRAREFFSSAARTWQRAYIEWVSYFTPAMRQGLYSDEMARAVGGYRAEGFLKGWFARVRGAHPLDQASYVDLHSFLPHNLLEYGDRMSMAHALELRLPFTDHRLVELAMATPAAHKLRGGRAKQVLRRALHDDLPREVLERPKLGLNPPLGIWLRGELAPLIERYLSPQAVRRAGWFAPQAVARLVDEFRAGRRDFSLHLWALLVLEQWRAQVLEAEPAAAQGPAEALEAAG